MIFLYDKKRTLLRPGGDQIFGALSHNHQRTNLLLLKQGAVETETDVMAREVMIQMKIPLIHNYLSRLNDTGYIEWDRDTGKISKEPCFDEIEPLLDLIRTHADELSLDRP